VEIWGRKFLRISNILVSLISSARYSSFHFAFYRSESRGSIVEESRENTEMLGRISTGARALPALITRAVRISTSSGKRPAEIEVCKVRESAEDRVST